MKQVGVLGGGIAGIICSNILKSQGHDVRLIDKGLKLGGRFASRKGYDYGVPCFQISRATLQKSPGIASLCASWHNDGISCFALGDSLHIHSFPMTRLIEGMSQRLQSDAALALATTVTAIHFDSEKRNISLHCKLRDSEVRSTFDVSTLISTMPIPQLLSLLSVSGLTVADDSIDALLKGVSYWPQMAVTVPNCDPPYLQQNQWDVENYEPLANAVSIPPSLRGVYECADTRSKRFGGGPAIVDRVIVNDYFVTIHSSVAFGRDILSSDDSEADSRSVKVANHLVKELSEAPADCIPKDIELSLSEHPFDHLYLQPAVSESQVHWWKYAQVKEGIAQFPYLKVPVATESGDVFEVKVCGDAFGPAHVEGAVVSAFECGFDVLEEITDSSD